MSTQLPLTKRNLALHNKVLQTQHATEAVTQWVERVIAEERTHLFYSQLGASISNLDAGGTEIELDMNHLDQQMPSAAATAGVEHALGGLKLFEERPYVSLETPLERFLTPGSSDPTYFYRPALAQMGIKFGSMEGAKERKNMARAHVELVRDRALKVRACSDSQVQDSSTQ